MSTSMSRISLPKEFLDSIRPEFLVYQDRNVHGGSSPGRWKRDLLILDREHTKNPFDARIQFYLAQTYRCMNNEVMAMRHYKQRYENHNGFWEERFQSALSIGEVFEKLYGDIRFVNTALPWYMNALSIEMRVEPLLKIAEYYIRTKQWSIAYMFVHTSISLPNSTSTLFVKQDDYDYTRYHKLGLVSYYVGEYDVGKEACMKAISKYGKDVDKNNFKFYTDKMEEMSRPAVSSTPKISIPTCKDRHTTRRSLTSNEHIERSEHC